MMILLKDDNDRQIAVNPLKVAILQVNDGIFIRSYEGGDNNVASLKYDDEESAQKAFNEALGIKGPPKPTELYQVRPEG